MTKESDVEFLGTDPAHYSTQKQVLRDVTGAVQYVQKRTGNRNGEKKEIHTLPDLMKYMKQLAGKHKLDPNERVALEQKITSRRMEEFGFSTQPVDDDAIRWDQRYGRRKEVMKTGYFSVNYKPYQPLGAVQDDPVKLFLSNFKDYWKEVPKFSYNLNGAVHKSTLPTMKTDQGLSDAKKNELCDILEREKGCKDAGLQLMRQTLAETNRRIIATSAGQSYRKHVQQCQVEREVKRCLSAKARQQDKSMKLQSLGSDLLHLAVASFINISSRDARASDKANRMAKAAETNKQSVLRYKQARKLQAITDKLHYIHVLLCSVYNMKNRYLKNKQPLSMHVVAALRRDPFTRRAEEARSRAQAVRTCSADTVGSRIDTRRTSCSRNSGEGTSRALPTIQVNDRRHSGFRNQVANQLLKIGMSHSTSPSSETGRRKTRSRLLTLLGSAQDTSAKVETWEDLVSLGTKTKLLKLLRQKALPPWQQHWSSDEPDTASVERDDEHINTYHSEEAVGRMRAGWLRVKERSQKSIRQEIEKIDRERMVKFGYKMDTLSNPDPLFEKQRDVIRQSARNASRDPVLITDHVVPWYEGLIKECNELGVRSEPKIVECLSKIEKFLLEDIQHIPYVKEKLCLLVLSLPIYEVCTSHVQTAITFVLSEILEGKASMFKEWLSHRKLYVINRSSKQ